MKYERKKVPPEELLRTVEIYARTGSLHATARELGMDRNAIRKRLQRAAEQGISTPEQQIATLHGINPEHDLTHAVPAPLVLKGTSTLYGEDGKPKLQWVKTRVDQELMDKLFAEYAKAFLEGLAPLPEIAAPKEELDTDIIPWFQIGDAHVGMLAHSNEVGHNFDLKIAERELLVAMQELIDRTPNCERCVIQDLGDMSHYQDFTAKSESGHDFDFDSRYPKMIEVCARIMRFIVDKALAKFKFVDVIINQGNHSRSNDVWMRTFLIHVYKDNPRLHVLDNSSVFIPYRMGNTFVMCHHGDKCKPDRLIGVMSTDFSADWGETTYRYIDIGHIHHRMQAKETAGVTVESWNQLAPGDKNAHDGGWRSRACLTAVLRSKTYGEKGRITISAEEVKDIIASAVPGAEALKRRAVYSV